MSLSQYIVPVSAAIAYPNYYLGTAYTVMNRSYRLLNGSTVEALAFYGDGGSAKLKVIRRNGPTDYDVLVDESISPSGVTGWQVATLVTPYAVPSTGFFYAALYSSGANVYGVADSSNGYKVGDLSGMGASPDGEVAEGSGLSPCLRADYSTGGVVPDAGDVRYGVLVGATTGTCYVPDAADVLLDVPVDDGLGTFDEADRNSDPGEGNVLAPVAYKILGVEKEGSLVPDATEEIIVLDTSEQEVTVNVDGDTYVLEIEGAVISGSEAEEISRTAGETINGGRAVRIGADGKAYLASNEDLDEVKATVGVSKGAAVEDDPVTIVVSGPIVEATWAWTPGSRLYFDELGILTATAPTSGHLRSLGVADTATRILVNVGETIAR